MGLPPEAQVQEKARFRLDLRHGLTDFVRHKMTQPLAKPITRGFLRSFFAKKRPPASLTRLLRNQLCPQAHRHFSFCELFVPLVSKRKSGLTVWVALLQRFCKAQTDTPLSFDTKGAKESSQRKRRLGRFARCDERQGLRSLDSRPLAWGLLWVAVRTYR